MRELDFVLSASCIAAALYWRDPLCLLVGVLLGLSYLTRGRRSGI
jgi:hypothetical protein